MPNDAAVLASHRGIPAYAGRTVGGGPAGMGRPAMPVVQYGRAGRQCRGASLGNGPDLTAGAPYFFDTGSSPAAELIGNADTAGLVNPLKVDVIVGVTVG